MTNIVVCYYRDWGKQISDALITCPDVNVIDRITSKEEYDRKINSLDECVKVLLFLGWSWYVAPDVTSKYLCIGIHPSDLPEYKGGSPIQNQIIDGVLDTKLTLMTLSDGDIDTGDIWGKEYLDLRGQNMDVIFSHIVESSIKVLYTFFSTYPNITPIVQNPNDGFSKKRRKPSDSRITIEDLQSHSLEWVYNVIRSLTDPYPNAYLEDCEGNRLYFKEVNFVSKNSSSDL